MKRYLITSHEFYGRDPDAFSDILRKQLDKHRPHYVLYRDKDNVRYEDQARDFINVCSQHKDVKSFIHQNVDLAKELDAAGVHLTSAQFDKIEYAKSSGLEVIISTHSHKEALQAQKLGADAITYSPIFASPGKGDPKGIEELERLLSICDINVFALGGIVTKEHVDIIEKTKAFGFASIRYFFN